MTTHSMVMSSMVIRSRGGKMKRRTAEEVEYLEKSFQENPLPNEGRRTEIAKILGIPERKVMIWFQNKRQRMKQKLKYVENINLKEENDALQRALTEERQREEYLRRENRELKVMLGTRQQRMEELRSRASRLLIEYYANKSEAGGPEAAAAIPRSRRPWAWTISIWPTCPRRVCP